MTRRLVFRPAAEADIDAAAAWLEDRSPRAAAKFWRSVDDKVTRLQENPFQYQQVKDRVRRAPLHGFGYAMFYFVTDDEIVVIAFIHGRRNPRNWQQRILE